MIGIERALRHMAWANGRVYDAVATLPDEALEAYIVNPKWFAGRILQHIVSGSTWYVHCLGIERYHEVPMPATMADVRELAVALARYDAQLFPAAAEDDAMCTFEDEDGPSSALRSTLLTQAVHHATEHRAQLIDALESRGWTSISLDDVDLWAFETWERTSAGA